MTSYENRSAPEGINYSQDHPLKDFGLLLLAALGGLLALLLVLSALAGSMAPLIPFSVERQLAESISSQFPAASLSGTQQQKQEYLRNLTRELVAQENLPEGLELTVHYMPGAIVNAFATLGGHVYIYEGLLAEMPSENALAMVLAHEVAHILHRDPITALGRGVTVSLALASVAGVANSSAVEWLLQQMGLVTVMSFTRDQERAADARALEILQAHYGHVMGAESIFAVFMAQEHDGELPEMLRTHPLSAKRVQAVEDYAEQHEQQGILTPLPEFEAAAEERSTTTGEQQ